MLLTCTSPLMAIALKQQKTRSRSNVKKRSTDIQLSCWNRKFELENRTKNSQICAWHFANPTAFFFRDLPCGSSADGAHSANSLRPCLFGEEFCQSQDDGWQARITFCGSKIYRQVLDSRRSGVVVLPMAFGPEADSWPRFDPPGPGRKS